MMGCLSRLSRLSRPSRLTVEGGVSFINPGSPVVSDAVASSQPIPRLPDGKVDLTGPWVGGGTIADIRRDGGRGGAAGP